MIFFFVFFNCSELARWSHKLDADRDNVVERCRTIQHECFHSQVRHPCRSIDIQADIETSTTRSEDIVIAVVGVTGVGKSTFISLFTDEDVGIGKTLESCKYNMH